ncbi:MAG: PAS domain S-box protein [Acidobacteriota bacterium]
MQALGTERLQDFLESLNLHLPACLPFTRLEDAGKTALHLTRVCLGYGAGALLVRYEHREPVVLASHGADWRGTSDEKGLLSFLWRKGHLPRVLRSSQIDLDFARSLDRLGLGNVLLSAPVVTGGRQKESLIGLVLAARPGHDCAIETDLIALQFIASFLAAAMASCVGVPERRARDAEPRKDEKRSGEDQQLFRAIFEEGPLGIALVGGDRRLIQVNPRLCQMLGYSAAQLTGLAFTDMTHPDDVDIDLQLACQLHKGVIPHYSIEKRYIKQDKESLWVNLTASLIRDEKGNPLYGLTMLEEITERKRAEETLKLAHFSVDRAADAIFWVKPDARFLYVNDSACRLLGYSRKELLSMRVHDIDPHFQPERWNQQRELIKKRGSLVFESRHRRKDGSLFPVEISASYLLFGGEEYSCTFVRDITERKRTEERRARMETQIQQAQKLESLGVLAGGIAHDFNNLLMGILGNADLCLREPSLTSPVRERVEQIERASIRAAELTRQMLAYSGRGSLEVRPVDLSDVVKEMTDLLATVISKKAAIRYKQGQTPVIHGDVTQIRQIIMNLITNASEALGDKCGVVTIATGVMERVDQSENYLDGGLLGGPYAFLEVSDTGKGMDKATRSRMFDPFFTTKFAGRGLGLAAVLGIVRGHKGAIRVTSEPGLGTNIKVIFPIHGSGAGEAAQKPDPMEAWKGTGTILIVDDDEASLAVCESLLQALGFQTLTAGNGHDGLRIYERKHRDIELVLLDSTMPVLDGEETSREMFLINSRARILLMSGYSEEQVTSRLSGQDVAGFIQKPFRLADLAAKVQGALKHSGR